MFNITKWPETKISILYTFKKTKWQLPVQWAFNLHQLKNVINQEKNQEEKKNFVYFYSILKMLISIKKQNSNNVRIHTSDSTGKDLNEVNLHNTQEPSKINEHLLECISLTIKTKGLKKIIYDRIYSLFFLNKVISQIEKISDT